MAAKVCVSAFKAVYRQATGKRGQKMRVRRVFVAEIKTNRYVATPP